MTSWRRSLPDLTRWIHPLPGAPCRLLCAILAAKVLAATAISAVDTALWDLKGRLLDQPLASLLGRYREAVPIYGSGGFTSYDDSQLARQLAGWVEREGCRWVKMKIGSDPDRDPHGSRRQRRPSGSATLFVDANGAFSLKQAQYLAQVFAANQDVRWFEEPVSSDDLHGLRRVRELAPPPMEIAAGEYGYTLDYFRRMLEAGAVDVQQADATRCGGVTGFLQAATLCEAYHTDLSAHCAPALHRQSRLCRAAVPPCGMVSRSCPHRAYAVRRRACAAKWRSSSRISRGLVLG